MSDNTDLPPDTGDAPFRFGLATRTHRPETVHLSLRVGGVWYETNAVFSGHSKATEFVIRLNNTVATGEGTCTQGEYLVFAFNTLYEQAQDIHRLIIHLDDGVILTGCLIDADSINPADVCRSMNRQTRLSEQAQDALIMHCIIGQAEIKAPVILH